MVGSHRLAQVLGSVAAEPLKFGLGSSHEFHSVLTEALCKSRSLREILAGALAEPMASEVPSVIRFDRARVLLVDLDPALYRRAARVITELRKGDVAALSAAALASARRRCGSRRTGVNADVS